MNSNICDFCPQEDAGNAPALSLCCPKGQKICYQCMVSMINASTICSFCDRPIGSRVGKLRSDFRKIQGGIENKPPQRNLSRINSSVQFNHSQRMNQSRGQWENQNMNASQYPHMYTTYQGHGNGPYMDFSYGQYMNPNFHYPPQPFMRDLQNYQGQLPPNYQSQSPQNYSRHYEQNYQNMNHSQSNYNQQEQIYLACRNPKNKYPPEFYRQGMQDFMNMARSGPISNNMIKLDSQRQMQEGIYNNQSNINGYSQGSYIYSRQNKTTDNMNSSNCYQERESSRSNRSSSLNSSIKKRNTVTK